MGTGHVRVVGLVEIGIGMVWMMVMVVRIVMGVLMVREYSKGDVLVVLMGGVVEAVGAFVWFCSLG